ncbi:hypothetical protein [Roseiterribacter gracilis]|uniref:Uncharacterized protein n=1 Tax=Roseiterribacter gracilis TaxID=2812848 RepID=A0A8S8XFY2_9PROT|nr:hypothetical protein TMPK1_31080 [Rhodospirillales bacterium TMPK1]
MTVRVDETGSIRLEGTCQIDDAELLQRLLLAHPAAAVDWRDCEHAHTALIQLILAARRTVRGPSRVPFLEKWIAPHFHALAP